MNNPRIKTPYDWTIEILSIICLIGSAYPMLRIGKLPDVIPVHFNITGVADGWGSRWFIGIIPLCAIVMYLSCSFAERYPKMINYPVNIKKLKSNEALKSIHQLGIRVVRYIKLFAVTCLCYLSNAVFSVAITKGDKLNVIVLGIFLVGICIALVFFVIKTMRIRRQYEKDYT
jgi:uncharacterized membrane protein